MGWKVPTTYFCAKNYGSMPNPKCVCVHCVHQSSNIDGVLLPYSCLVGVVGSRADEFDFDFGDSDDDE